MNTTHLSPFQGSLQAVLDFLQRQQLQGDLEDLNGQALTEAELLDNRELEALQALRDFPEANFEPVSEEEARTFLDHVHLLLEQFTLVIDTNEPLCDRVKQVFFNQYKLFRFLAFSGLVISSVQLKQDWDLIQEESSCECKKAQALVLRALVVGGLFGIVSSFDSKDLLSCFWAKFDMAAERSQMIEEEGIS